WCDVARRRRGGSRASSSATRAGGWRWPTASPAGCATGPTARSRPPWRETRRRSRRCWPGCAPVPPAPRWRRSMSGSRSRPASAASPFG
ncbi:MAG: Acylphosphate phosphohydrolase, putative, partial [uncultured Acidimicrobiales bacterium]